MTDDFNRHALELLRQLTNRPDSEFRDGQLEAIRGLVIERDRVLVVQRTGWGKSAVYFLATRLLRDQGAGPTILISPLLALMRNQITAAARMGIRAATINSSNESEWDEVGQKLQADEVDLLLISPERLANKKFRDQVLTQVGSTAGLVVVDEAHCISDWGHDFRPDYRRVRNILNNLPSQVPVLACTATANDRVMEDIRSQLGSQIEVRRGQLARPGLSLVVLDLPAPAQRLAWLAQVIPGLPGSGIVYCLTTGDVETVSDWLNRNGIVARGYWGGAQDRPELEQQLIDNELKVLVATSALGMGFDKPDLGFVIHYQAPGTPIAYYQQVGRAGRQLDRSVGVLLQGSEDEAIQDWFISRAFPTRSEADAVVEVLESKDGFTSRSELLRQVNIRQSRLELLLKNLEVDGAITSEGQKYQRTPRPWQYDEERVDAISKLRRDEQQQMKLYASGNSGCRMEFLQKCLDDSSAAPCGHCDVCRPSSLTGSVDSDLVLDAVKFLRRRPLIIKPRLRWATGGNIPAERRVSEGRCLCRWGDGGWGDQVRQGKQVDGRFSNDLVAALADLIQSDWRPTPSPTWITYVPSKAHPTLVEDLARRLGVVLGLPVIPALGKKYHTEPQKKMENSARQLSNIRGSFEVLNDVPDSPVLLVDDVVDSRWTFTAVGDVLREAGCPLVYPVALANTGAQ